MKHLCGAGLALLLVLLCINATHAVNRCLFTHGDPPCQESGALPITLECRYPGKWFQVMKTEELTPARHWTRVSMEKSADNQCKKTKKPSGKNYACKVAKLSDLHRVRITYFCWEFNPDLLGGFGRKRREKFPLPLMP